MKFSFTGRHMEIGKALTSRAEEACVTLAEKYGDEFIDVSIVMKTEAYLFQCDISAKTKNGSTYHATNESDDPTASFLGTIQKLDQQMRKKKKMSCRSSCKSQPAEFNEYDNSLAGEKDAPMIIAEILEDLPLLSVSDASRKLDKNKVVFIFENISNNAVNVVYKRCDGNIGWIDYKIKG